MHNQCLSANALLRVRWPLCRKWNENELALRSIKGGQVRRLSVVRALRDRRLQKRVKLGHQNKAVSILIGVFFETTQEVEGEETVLAIRCLIDKLTTHAGGEELMGCLTGEKGKDLPGFL